MVSLLGGTTLPNHTVKGKTGRLENVTRHQSINQSTDIMYYEYAITRYIPGEFQSHFRLSTKRNIDQ